ncbi:hypothetical protein SmJEL517_g05464 [Synchytrium microbalum]|uniref:Uncharacterized protein n=1 Tax=Synchytrium microbalum TaxID=1806994 RepID=A0A507BW71_9FUNG|nr:uncharacterized protein SmJEL517_g05464 [Synchytrium microbalum]TPX31149.1 hypothetical protein SmJEL517_g05464 [Synchytrium microbalum]
MPPHTSVDVDPRTKDLSTTLQRPLVIKRHGVETAMAIPILLWPLAESIRDTLPDSKPTVSADGDDNEYTEIDLVTQVLGFSLSKVTADNAFERLPFVATVFSHFQHQFLRHHNIHTVVRDMPSETQSTILKTYYAALVALRKQGLISREEFLPSPSALMSAADSGKARLFAVFGGQGNIEEYFDELVSINASYEALIKPFLIQSALTLAQHSASAEAQRLHTPQIDVVAWLEKPDTRPSTDALLAASVSLPVIGLVQLLNYWVTMKVLDKTPADFRRYFQGATGHSQGIISAAVISASETDKEFVDNTQKALGLLFWIGARCQAACPTTTVNPNILEDSLENGEGVPTPMLSIVGLRVAEVQKQVDATNVHLPTEKQIALSLINGPRAIICTGAAQSLYGLNVALRKLKADPGVDQTRVPHSQRKIRFSSRFLPVMVPFHSPSLAGVANLLDEDVKARGLSFDACKLAVPVFNTNTGEDLRGSRTLTRDLCDMICTLPVKWELATRLDKVTHLIDFGPGGASGIGGLTHKNKEGTGVQVILAGTLDAQKEELLEKSAIFDFDPATVKYAPNWAELYRPRLLRIKRTGDIHVDTPFSRLIGKPHLMVAGMTPATVSPEFCAAVTNAGYHVEWAGGGQYNEYILRLRTEQIMNMIKPGEGIGLNMLFLNSYQWGFQYPTVISMRQAGIPLDSVTIGAGVPSLDVANEFIANFRAAGVRHCGFKPGSGEMIRRVIQIAKSNPDFPICLQWTGGRAGGHHSFEDFHQPMLENYGSIRRQPNIILIAGSGFGGADDTLPYLTGSWSEKFDFPPMPFDGVLFGSRVMVAKEGNANRAVKELIVQATGVESEGDWEKTYRGAVGGVITVQSELGEPIHKIANRGIIFWKELDEHIFSQPRGEKRAIAVAKRKDWIIQKLNADYQKPFFGKKTDGHVADLHEMTYKEVADRMVELMYIRHQKRWLDVSLRNLTGDFLRRIEERFSLNEAPSMIQTNNELNEPDTFLAGFFEAFPPAAEQTLTNEDVLHFLAICGKRVWQKPVPFVPVVDGNLEFWFKKDSLWQSEDLDAVVGRDAQRVPILQGPVAVKYSKIVDEPVADILGNIYSSHIQSIKDMYYSGKNENIPVVEYLGARGGSAHKLAGVSVSELPGEESSIMYEITRTSSDLPADADYLDVLAQPDNTWLRAFITSPSIVRGHLLVPNPVQRILRPRPRQTVFVQLDKTKAPQLVTVYDEGQTGIPSRHPALVISHEGDNITLTLYEKRDNDYVPLQFMFQYRPGLYPIHEVMEGRNQRIKSFYGQLWYVDSKAFNMSTQETFKAQFRVDRQRISDFTTIVGNTAEMYVSNGNAKAPMDFAIVAGWQALVTAILPKEIDGDLLRLVHLSNEFRMLDQSGMIEAGDDISAEAVINAVIISDAGKTVEVKATLFKQGRALLEILSRFLYRGKFSDYDNTFRRTVEKPMQVDLKTKKDVAVLMDKKWVKWTNPSAELSTGSTLIFRLNTLTKFKNDKLFAKVSTIGSVFLKTTRETVEIGTVNHEESDCVGNVVLEYLNRNGTPIEQAVYFSTGGYSILPDRKVFPAVVTVPPNNVTYARASGDLNPIHVNPYFADLASLPGTITHGMWTSASTRKFVEIFAANNHPDRVKEYQVTFVDMVLPGDQLETKLYHVGMINGRKLIKIETLKLESGVKVLEGTAEVDQPTTSYVFTGQGSQEPSMGMELYASSPIAKDIWDRADSHMINTYGVSILDIVKNNPKSKTVHFGGPKGSRIRDQYMGMMYDVVGADGKTLSRPLFPDIIPSSSSFTFNHPAGLLSATQFTQPALVLMEIASFQDMKHSGLVQEDCPFAGHSLGEYAALCSVGEVLTVESLVDVVFYRGMTMQVAVPRHPDGRSDYGMVAVNPLRVGPTMGEQALKFVISAVGRRSNALLEIVNFNVENFQYVVAGEVTCLDVLRLVLNKIKTMNLNFIELTKTRSVKEIEQLLNDIVDGCLAESRKRAAASGGTITQERGIATIPLAGIDVPFHSSFLLNGVSPFREILRKKLEPRFINVSLLIHKYIPNLTARPFELSKSYFQEVYDQTHSVLLKNVLENWKDSQLVNPAEKQRLGYLLLIELLAHQFASPVLWIQTQDRLFKEYEVERLIEVGPGPVLCGMAQRTLKSKYEAYDDAVTRRRVTLCTSKDAKDIYYDFEDEPEAAPEGAPADASGSAPAASASAAPAAAATSAPAAPSAPRAAGNVTDANVTVSEIIHVLVAQKLKKSLAEIPMTKAIKDLVGGKSTLQNEILGDLGAEFGPVLADKAEEVPLGEVASLVQMQHSGNLGKTSTTLINKLISGKMPGGFGMGNVKAHLSATHGLGPKRIEGVLLHGLASEPPTRLGTEGEAKAWLDAQSTSYAAKVGITLGGAAVSAAAGGAAGGPVVNSEDFELLKAKTEALVRQQLEQFAKYLQMDLLEGAGLAAAERDSKAGLQADLDMWIAEHGDEYAEGIRPVFSKLKARSFDSSWNWARQDALRLYYDMIFGRITAVDRDLMNQVIHLMNRTEDQGLIAFMEFLVKKVDPSMGEGYKGVKEYGQIVLDNCRAALNADPVYKNVAYRPTRPRTYATEDGKLVYKEERRTASNMKDYVKDMRTGSALTRLPPNQTVIRKFEELQSIITSTRDYNAQSKARLDGLFADIKANLPNGFAATTDTLPFIFLKERTKEDPSAWEPSAKLTQLYLDALTQMAADGITFKGKEALMTGCGKDSIGVEVLKALLSGGARVIVTTSRFSKSVTEYYRSIYERHGSKGSRLIVVPFNGGSVSDVKALIEYIYDDKHGLGWDLDFVIPFAAIPVVGREIDNIDSRSELAHRIMLNNLLRLMGEIKNKKQALGYDTRPAAVMLPLSPNHGTFGADGLYGEAKIALETLLNRFHAEHWNSYLTIIGAVIGWTRGTGLMAGNNIVAEGIESLGARTFSQHEMAFNLAGLLHPSIVKLAETEPVWADLNGGLHFVADLNTISSGLRNELTETAETRRAIAHEKQLDERVIHGPKKQETVVVTPKANFTFRFPEMPKAQTLTHLRGMLDLEKVVVVTGFGEVGPLGGSRTRWEMEAMGEFSLEGCVEMAWLMGYIKFHDGPLKKNPWYTGWIDLKTEEPLKDHEVKSKFEKDILDHTGIRLIEPSLFDGYDPQKKMFLQEVAVTADMAPVECSKEEAEAFKHQHGDNCVVEQQGDQYFIRIKKGATLYVPKALQFDRLVAGQVPTGWNAARYGVPPDIVRQVDPITLYVLVSTVEALVTSGVTDPYEFYQYVHVSEVGNTAGGGMGGVRALRLMFKDRFMEKPVQNDILQETFINTMPAWINMLLLSSSGPIKTPVGACATAAESVEIGVETIVAGRAKIVLCGGYDDFQEEGSYEFANMKATSSAVEEYAHGREPKDMCRPATDTRGGFMESQGAGIHVLMAADLAIKMGVPIRGIIALTNTATDKNGRSIPAPGQGILTTAKELKLKNSTPMLNFGYRQKQLRREREHIRSWVTKEYEALTDEVEAMKAAHEPIDETFMKDRAQFIDREGNRREKIALQTWSHDWWKNDPSIAPIRGALATYGLTIDDLGVASFHGTGTKANDYNESSVLNQQLAHLGRTAGNACPGVFQKYLTGHPKGAAAAWMLNGVLQILETGIIPGNRNADNIDKALRKFENVFYPSQSIKTDGIKAGLLKSFGFGQAGGEVMVIHPDYLFAALEEKEYQMYAERRSRRETASYQYFHEMLTGAAPFVRVKAAAPYTDEQASSVYLNPLARAGFDKHSKSWNFTAGSVDTPSVDLEVVKLMTESSSVFGSTSADKGVGIDVQLISEINDANETFLARNFTTRERRYCDAQPNPQASYAGRWAAKEAVIKAVSSAAGGNTIVWNQGSGAPLIDIEITREADKAPVVTFYGAPLAAVQRVGVKEVKVTISHSGNYAVAAATAK